MRASFLAGPFRSASAGADLSKEALRTPARFHVSVPAKGLDPRILIATTLAANSLSGEAKTGAS